MSTNTVHGVGTIEPTRIVDSTGRFTANVNALGELSVATAVSTAIPSNYLPRAEDNSAVGNSLLYVGYSPIGTATSATSWTIMKVTYDSNGVLNGQNLFASVTGTIPATNLVWDNRASYSYS